MDRPLLTTRDLARLLAKTPEQIRTMRKRGQLPPPVKARPGLGLRWRPEAIDAWIEDPGEERER